MFGKSKAVYEKEISDLGKKIRDLEWRNRTLEVDLKELRVNRKCWSFLIPRTKFDGHNETDAHNLANVSNYLSKQGIPTADITWVTKDLVFLVEYRFTHDLTKQLEEIVGLCGVDKTESPDGTGNA